MEFIPAMQDDLTLFTSQVIAMQRDLHGLVDQAAALPGRTAITVADAAGVDKPIFLLPNIPTGLTGRIARAAEQAVAFPTRAGVTAIDIPNIAFDLIGSDAELAGVDMQVSVPVNMRTGVSAPVAAADDAPFVHGADDPVPGRRPLGILETWREKYWVRQARHRSRHAERGTP